MPTNKLYCYVDETGQDTKGKFFLVTVVIEEQKDLDTLQNRSLINFRKLKLLLKFRD